MIVSSPFSAAHGPLPIGPSTMRMPFSARLAPTFSTASRPFVEVSQTMLAGASAWIRPSAPSTTSSSTVGCGRLSMTMSERWPSSRIEPAAFAPMAVSRRTAAWSMS